MKKSRFPEGAARLQCWPKMPRFLAKSLAASSMELESASEKPAASVPTLKTISRMPCAE